MTDPAPAAAPTGPKVLVANPSADLYGSDRMMLEAVRGLTARGWPVVVTCSTGGPLVAELETAGARVRILPVPVIRKSMLSPRGLVGLARQTVRGVTGMRRLLRTERPDVLLVNTVTLPMWLLVGRLSRRPVVLYVHEAESSLSTPARLALAAPSLLATRAVYNSKTSARVAGLRLMRRRSQVIPNGVRGPAAVRPPRPELIGPFRIVYVGRLSPRKGVDLVLRAAHRLQRAGLAVEVELVGSVFPGYEWYESELRDLARFLGIEPVVHFTGFRADVWDHLARADVAVVPSRLDESFGNTVIEALLAARPVVVSDHTGLREAASGFEAVRLVRRDDDEALAVGLRDVVEHWSTWRERAESDAVRAAERLGPARFHASLAAALRDAGRPQDAELRRQQNLGSS